MVTTLAERLAERLGREAGYGPVTAERIARGWADLAVERGWTEAQAFAYALDCTAYGISAEALRRAFEPKPIERLGIGL
jgi:hypothetical protein